MDQLHLPISGLAVEEGELAGHIGPGVVVGDDELPILSALLMGQWVAPLEGQDVKVLVQLADEGAVVVGQDP